MTERCPPGRGWRGDGLVTITEAPIEPCEWDLLLKDMALGDEQAVLIIRRGGNQAARITSFVRNFFHHRFVPEPVLAELGLASAAERSAHESHFSLRRAMRQMRALKGE